MAIAEGLGVEPTRRVTVQVHEVMRSRASQCGGYVAEANAESVMVYFGYPCALQGAEEIACQLALAIVDGTASLAGVCVHMGLHAAVSIVGRIEGAGGGLGSTCCTTVCTNSVPVRGQSGQHAVFSGAYS